MSENLPPHNNAGSGADLLGQMVGKLYSLASTLLGEGEESVVLVESAIATTEVPEGADSAAAQRAGLRALARKALASLNQKTPGSLAAPVGIAPVATCIGDDDLDAAAAYGDELGRMLSGPDRGRARAWLEGLPATERAIFALRAVAGFSSETTAALLAEAGGAGWTAEAVREIFRQALCSVASQLLHSTTAQ